MPWTIFRQDILRNRQTTRSNLSSNNKTTLHTLFSKNSIIPNFFDYHVLPPFSPIKRTEGRWNRDHEQRW